MILLLPVVVFVLVALAVILGIGPMAFGAGGDELAPRRRLLLSPLAAVPIGLVVLIVLLGAVTGLRSASESGPSSTAAPASPTTTTNVVLAEVVDAESPSPVLGPTVTLDQGVHAIGELEGDTVLRMRVTDFPPFTTARAKQCTEEACGNAIAVQFREDGTASFQYLIVDDFSPTARGRCAADTTPCSIVVENVDGEGRAEITTVFEDPLPAAGRLEVQPTAGLVEGDEVSVRLDGFSPGIDLEVVLCAAPATEGPARCGEPGPVIPVTIRDDGTAAASLVARVTPVGTERMTCGRGSGCAVAVRSSSAFVRAPQVPLRFAAPPGADYDPPRLLIGLAIALVLALGAVLLIHRTDWSAIGEEAAPEIDGAEYADLDAIIALLPPEEDAVDVPEPAGGRRWR